MPEKTRELFRQLLHQHAVFQLKRYGSAFVHSIAIAGHVFETKMVLNEAFDWKERADNPDYDNTVCNWPFIPFMPNEMSHPNQMDESNLNNF